jgi:hypothetical protein
MPAAGQSGRGGWGYAPAFAPAPHGGTALEAAPALKAVVESKAQNQPADGEVAAGDFAYTVSALQSKAGEVMKDAQETLKQGTELKTAGKLDEARVAFARAYLLDSSAVNVGYSGGETAAQALAALEEIHAERVKAWSKGLPALDKRLDLVLRDVSLEAALAAVAKAGGVNVKLTAGSVADAAALTGTAPHVRYLDLRRATVAQALDWLLLPERLSWRVDGEAITAGSDRRLAGVSAWVYDVSAIALPSQKELADLKDNAKAVAAATAAADEFLAACKTALKPAEEKAIVWYAPGQLLVVGDAKLHVEAAALLANLADAAYKSPEPLAKLHAVASKRAAERKESLAQDAALRRLLEVAQAHDEFGWQLLAASLDGKVDLEALTELQIAWNSPETKKLLAGDGPAVALRSLWIVREASRAVPDNAELKLLAASAAEQSRSAVRTALEALRKNPDDASAFTAALYGALALTGDAALAAEALPLLTTGGAKDSPLASARLLAGALLDKPGAIDRAALSKLAASGAAGEDMIVLLSLACRRAGGDVWQAFRAERRDLLAGSPLPGSVVVLISRL